MPDCTWYIDSLKQEDTVQNHSATVSKNIELFSWLCDVFQTVRQKRFVELICAGSDWGEVLGISEAADSVIVTTFRQ